MHWTDREILAWLEEQLPVDRMATFETELRQNDSLRGRVARVIREHDQGGATVGEIWRRARLSCPGRSELGSFLLGTLPTDTAAYFDFHLRTIGCRICQANLQDLEEQSRQSDSVPARRQRFFQSSAGLLRPSHGTAASDGSHQ